MNQKGMLTKLILFFEFFSLIEFVNHKKISCFKIKNNMQCIFNVSLAYNANLCSY